MPTATIDGVKLHYDIEGEGPPLLLISGLGGNSGVWATVKPLLAPHFKIITFDNRGTGRSDTPPGPYTIDQMADDTAGLIRHLDLGPDAFHRGRPPQRRPARRRQQQRRHLRPHGRHRRV